MGRLRGVIARHTGCGHVPVHEQTKTRKNCTGEVVNTGSRTLLRRHEQEIGLALWQGMGGVEPANSVTSGNNRYRSVGWEARAVVQTHPMAYTAWKACRGGVRTAHNSSRRAPRLYPAWTGGLNFLK